MGHDRPDRPSRGLAALTCWTHARQRLLICATAATLRRSILFEEQAPREPCVG